MDKRSSIDQVYLRRMNQRLVLNNVFANGITSRTAMAKALSMSKPAIANNLKDLMDLNIVFEAGEGNATPNGGRRPRLLKFNDGYKYIIAIDLNYKEPICALCNLKGKILGEIYITTPGELSGKTYAKIIIDSIYSLMALKDVSFDNIACIAVCSPGTFDNNGKLLVLNPDFSGIQWCKVDFIPVLQNEFGVKVIVKNDIKAAAIGEWISIQDRKTSNMVFFSCGVGIGIGLILNAQLYEGERFAAGEIYHHVDPVKYARREKLESNICIAALQRRVAKAVQKGAVTSVRVSDGGKVDFDAIVAAYQENDAYILEVIESVALEISCSLANTVNLLDIRDVVIAGEYLVFKETLLKKAEQVFSRCCQNMPTVRASVLGKYQGIKGISHIAKEWYLDDLLENCQESATAARRPIENQY